MATYDYSRLQVIAERLITKFGTSGCRIMRPASTGDALTPWKAEPAPDEEVATDVVAVGDKTTLGQDEGTTLAAGGKAYIRAAETPQPNDRLEVPDGSTDGWARYSIKSADAINPGGTRLLWVLTLGD